MSSSAVTISQAQARRLAISRQLLSGARPPAGAELAGLAAFAGADAVEFGDSDTVPDRWRSTLLG
ncbi:hypothetical protein P3T35_001245 [Kitasatospora sp. GP30]|nr:hypothetical protein [Kitasatospora sp. GP30]